MRTRIISTLIFSFAVLFAHAADAGEQVLVFRKSGAVDIFSSATLKSIETVFIDNEGQPDKIAVQRFVTADSIMVVPVEEIDSVTFGSRNGIIAKKDVWHITKEHLPFITSFETGCIRYSPSAPPAYIPPAKVKIYCDEFCEQFPAGFCGETVSVVREAGGSTAVTVNRLLPEEVFDYYFYAEKDPDVVLSVPMSVSRAADFDPQYELKLDDYGVTLAAGVQIDIKLSNVVIRPIERYCHARVTFGITTGVDVEIEIENSQELKLESPSLTLVRAITGPLLTRIDASLFADIEASLKLDFIQHIAAGAVYEWTHDKGKNTFTLVDDNPEDYPRDLTTTTELVLGGEVFTGLKSRLILSPVMDFAGAYVQGKTGLKLAGEFGFETIQKLSEEVRPQIAPKYNLTASLMSRIDTYAYVRGLGFGDINEIPLPFSLELTWGEKELDLLPFLSSRATPCQTPEAPGVPVAPGSNGIETASTTLSPIVAPLTVGYDVVREDDLERIVATNDSIGCVEPMTDDVQALSGSTPVAPADLKTEKLKVRPFVKYAGYKVPYPLCDVVSGMRVYPFYTAMAGAGVYLVGGAPIIGQKSDAETVKIVGNYMPVSTGNGLSGHRSESLVDGQTLVGRWTGNNINITFSSNGTVNYNGRVGSYKVNNPQAGMVSLLFSDGSMLAITVVSCSNNTLVIAFPPYAEHITLKK